MANVAGLDLSLRNSGVAIIKDSGEVLCMSLGYALKRESTERDRIERVISIANEVMGILISNDVRHVGIESYAFSGQTALLAELSGVLKVQIYIGMKIVPLWIGPGSVRKYLLGKDGKDKNKLRKHLSEKGFNQPKNLDESDALGIACVVNDWANKRELIADVDKMSILNRLDYNQAKSKKAIK